MTSTLAAVVTSSVYLESLQVCGGGGGGREFRMIADQVTDFVFVFGQSWCSSPSSRALTRQSHEETDTQPELDMSLFHRATALLFE